jgi:transposase
LYLKNEDKEIDMGKPRFTEDFKIDAIKQITERGHSVADVSTRLGVSTHSLYGWIKRYSIPTGSVGKEDQSAEIRRLRQELVRVTEERDILKKATVYFARDANLSTFAAQIVCRSVNEVHLYQGASSRIYSADYVPDAPCSSKWLLCVAEAAVQQTCC